jgi:hypothetical protein
MRMEMRIMRMMVMMGTVMARINNRVPLSSGSDKLKQIWETNKKKYG